MYTYKKTAILKYYFALLGLITYTQCFTPAQFSPENNNIVKDLNNYSTYKQQHNYRQIVNESSKFINDLIQTQSILIDDKNKLFKCLLSDISYFIDHEGNLNNLQHNNNIHNSYILALTNLYGNTQNPQWLYYSSLVDYYNKNYCDAINSLTQITNSTNPYKFSAQKLLPLLKSKYASFSNEQESLKSGEYHDLQEQAAIAQQRLKDQADANNNEPVPIPTNRPLYRPGFSIYRQKW